MNPMTGTNGSYLSGYERNGRSFRHSREGENPSSLGSDKMDPRFRRGDELLSKQLMSGTARIACNIDGTQEKKEIRLMRSCHLPAVIRNTTICALLSVTSSYGAGVPTAKLPDVIVTGALQELQGAPVSASQGVVMQDQIELRPILRTGELLEVVPGLVVTQHSGDGKANQYFLRGFNLDHGTDLATSVDSVPVNMPTHAHGQGYSDLNFVIPELLQSIEYRKGTYYAETGNFSAAGAVNVHYRDKLDQSVISLEGGEHDYRRAVLGFSPQLGTGSLLVGLEYASNDGPWKLPEDFRKTNGLLKYSIDTGGSRWSITAQGYDGRWLSTDQIPLRAVQDLSLDRFGFIDPTDGGETHRYGVAAEWSMSHDMTNYRALVYGVDYKLDLFSNFTYFTDQVNGDQIEQFDKRRIYGGEFGVTNPFTMFGIDHAINAGLQWRRDAIAKVGLYRTTARYRYETVREDAVVQSSYSFYTSVDSRFGKFVRSVLGVRADRYEFDVASDTSANSGKASATLASPKFALILGPWQKTEFFANIGCGFHSNDARGTTITVDPADGVTPVDRVDPLVKALGYDVGLRTALIPNAQLSVSLYGLELDSELLYVGDEGATEASGASKRSGIELGVVYSPIKWLIVDADAAFSHSRFSNGDRIPNAVENVISIGIAANHPSGFNGGIRFRHFGSAPLIEDNSVRSSPTTVVNVEAGYVAMSGWTLKVAVYNVADRRDNDITYFYESQLASETAPVEGVHFHPVEPRTVRASVGFKF